MDSSRGSTGHIKALAQRRPLRKSAQVRWLWPQIREALAAGHTIADVRRELALDGLDISYSRLRTYVARLRRQSAAEIQRGTHANGAVRAHTAATPATSVPERVTDPLANIRRAMEQKRNMTFEYNPFPDPKDETT